MKTVGSSKQDGIPSPDNPVEIKNETILIITDKEGNKKEMPFKYEKILKEGDKIEKINEKWCLVRRKPMNDEEKKAIERIDYIQDFIIENGQYNADVNDMQYFSKVLNVIKKQSKEIEELIQRNKDLEEIEKEHKEENGRLREELEKYQSLLAKSTADRVVTSIKDNKKTKEDLEMLNEGWKIKLKEIVDLYNNTLQCTRKYNQELADILCDLQELLEESEK